MTKEELAAQFNGRQMGDEITKEEQSAAKKNGLVIVFGYSDDNIELRGAIEDEVGGGDGTVIRVTAKGVAPKWDDFEEKTKEDAKAYFDAQNQPGGEIEAVWGDGEYSWQFKTSIPHAAFDIMEDDTKFSRGIVFALSDLPKA
jgi:hypothetical protein